MNEDYLKQIDELLAQGKTLDEVYDDIVFSEGFSGNEAALFQTIELKKKDSAAEEDSGLEDPSTQPAQPTISDLDPEDSGSSLQASQLELVDRAKSEIGNDYAFWLKNSLSSGDEMTSYEPEGDSILKKFTKGLGTHYMRAATDALGLDAISGVYDLQDIYAASSDFLFQKDGQEIRKDMPVPPQNTPAYKQWYNSLPPSAQADVAKPKDYLDFEFTPEQEQLADDAYAEIEKELFAVEGLAESMLSYKKTSREILQGELDSGEINQDEFMKGNDDINNDYLQRVYQNFMEEKGSDIVKKYIGEIDEGTDFAEAFSDKLFYEYGLDTDLDGDGIYNAQTYTGLDMEAAFLGIFSKTSLESADAELYRMGTGLESLVENSIDFVAESLGSDYASDEYFENQRAYINKRYEAESADATFVAKSLKDSLTPSQFDFTAAMTHSGNLVGTMLPLITATAIEEIATAGAATPVVAAQWAGLAARLGLTAARLGRAGKALSKVGKFTSEKLIKGAASEITYGVSSGAATYNSIADEEGWGNGALGTADKIVYSIVTGAGDYALSRLGKHGFRTASAQKYAQGMLRDGKILAASSNQFINRQLIKGFAMKRGLNLGGEALSEATTNASQYLIKADSKRESITLEELANEAIDGALSGIAVGGAFDVMGSTFGRAKAAKAKYGKAEGKFSDRVKAAFKAGAKYDIDFGNDLRVLKQDLKAFNDQLKNTKSKSERETLEKVIAKEEAKIKFIEAMGQPFYDMLSVRHPEVIEQLNEKDTEIAIVAAKYRAAKDGSPQEKALAGQLKVLVDQRTRIEAEYRSENKDYRLTGEEKLSLTDRKIEDKLTEMSDELELQKLAATERQNDGESVSESVKKEGEVTLSKQQQKVEEANEILSRYKEARKAKEEAESKGESEEKINELAESEGAVQQELLAYLDLDVRNGIVIKKDQAPFVDAATRKTDVWLNEALESLEDSGLTKEQITKLLKDKKVTALTAENPMNRDTDNATNESRNKEAEAWLKDQGLVYHKIIGKYEKGENSFLVEDMSVEQGIAFAKKFDQDSVAMPQGLVNQKGQVQLFEEGVDIDENIGDDFFSAIRDTEGNIVRFSLPLSDKYIDSDGKEITKDQYETVLEKDIDVDEETGEVKSTTVKAYKDGSYRIPEDAPGMTDPARKLLNVFMPIVEQMYPGAKLVIIHDADSADAIGKELGIENFSDNGGYWDGKGTVYVNPSAVDFNAKLENLEKKKTLEETILEETIHAILQPTIQGMDAKKLEGIRDELKEIIKNDLALTNRVEAKGSSYTKQGKGVKEVLEEEVVEILSAIVADPSSVNTTLISKIRAILNKIINTLGRKELTINSDSSAIKILHALNNASNLKVEAQAKAEAQDKASKRISPYSLKEQGPITVKYNKTIYKYSKGVKKDIGSRPDEKTFNGKWHFINWWKKIYRHG
jgi:ribosomal protein L22